MTSGIQGLQNTCAEEYMQCPKCVYYHCECRPLSFLHVSQKLMVIALIHKCTRLQVQNSIMTEHKKRRKTSKHVQIQPQLLKIPKLYVTQYADKTT